MNNSCRWRIGAVATAIALLGGLTSMQAHALALGRVTVQSTLGEPLRAEIDIPEINAEEAKTLRASVAKSDAYRAAGIEFGATVANMQISLQRRADGRAYLRLSGDRPVREPFVDLILEARWSSGLITRDYTMLFDPPEIRRAESVAPAVSAAPFYPPSVAPAPAAPPAPTPTPPPPAPTPAVDTSATQNETIKVKAGDTAGQIAAQYKPASVSLDQMLVALLLSNPNAFIGGNVNLIKAGAVLDMPGTDEVQAIPAREASQTIVAQSKDFNEFRRKLANSAPAVRVDDADRQAAGQIQAKVEDRTIAATTPDKLTLSKGAVQGKAAAEEAIARERQANEAAARVAELSKNISELNKLGITPTPAAAPAPAVAPAPAMPTVAVPTPDVLAGALPATAAPELATAPASGNDAPGEPAPLAGGEPLNAAPATPEPAPMPAPVVAKTPAVIPPPPPTPSLVDELIDNPLVLAGGAGVLVLLAAFGVYRTRRNKGSASVDSSYLESRLQPDSFFGASGGQRIDTDDADVTGSSMVYSPSQLDAAGDVDPVAEADVYLAYGRDLQAEEILKEAIRVTPSRIAIHSKLLEIYAKRGDIKAFESTAASAFKLTKGQGVEWAHAAEMGRGLDPVNPMYQPGGQHAPANPVGVTLATAGGAKIAAQNTAPQTLQQFSTPSEVPTTDFDLDLDFSLDDEPADATASDFALSSDSIGLSSMTEPASLSALNSGAGSLSASTKPVSLKAGTPAPKPDANGLSFTTEPLVTAAPASPPSSVGDMMEFDLGALSLDLDDDGPSVAGASNTAKVYESAPTPTTAPSPLSDTDDPMETKFALAEEFRAIGDIDGARSLAEEVIAQSSGSLQGKAKAFLNALV